MIKLSDKDRLIVQLDKVLGEARVELFKLKQELSEISNDEDHNP